MLYFCVEKNGIELYYDRVCMGGTGAKSADRT